MARRGQSAWNRKFGQVARECFRENAGGSMKSYGACMRSELKKASPKKARKKSKKKGRGKRR